MRLWIRLMILSVFALSGAAGAAWAEEPSPKAEGVKSASIEMNADEIKGDLGNVVDSFKMDRMEILGDMQGPKMLFNSPWDPPDPFYSETEGGTARQLVDQAYRPVDRENFDLQAELIGGPDEAGSAGLASAHSPGFLGVASNETR